MVCDVGFGVWCACSWDEVGNCVVDWFAAYVAGSTPAAYVLPHASLHGAVALAHVRCLQLDEYDEPMRELKPTRVAFGLSKKPYVWSAIGVGVLLSLIPAVGPVLALALAVFAVAYWLTRPTSDAPARSARTASAASADYVPFFDVEPGGRQEVVGESGFQSAISSVVEGSGRKVHVVLSFDASQRGRVRVDLVGDGLEVQCGWLPDYASEQYGGMVLIAAQQHKRVRCPAVIRGGYETAPSYGVWLVSLDDSWYAPAVEVSEVFEPVPESAFDLRVAEGTSCAIAGISHWVDDSDIAKSGQLYLRREPSNEHDVNAVAVYAETRKVGYLSAGRAKSYAPLLDQLGGQAVVSRDESRSRASFFLPPIPEMRKIVKAKVS